MINETRNPLPVVQPHWWTVLDALDAQRNGEADPALLIVLTGLSSRALEEILHDLEVRDLVAIEVRTLGGRHAGRTVERVVLNDLLLRAIRPLASRDHGQTDKDEL